MSLTHISSNKATGVKVLYSLGKHATDTNVLNDIIAVPMNKFATLERDGRRRLDDNVNATKEKTNDVTIKTNDVTKRTKRMCSCRLISVVLLGVVVLWIASSISGVVVYHVIKGHLENVTESVGTKTNDVESEELKIMYSHLASEMKELKSTVHSLKDRINSTDNGTNVDRRLEQLETAVMAVQVQNMTTKESISSDEATLDGNAVQDRQRLDTLESAVKSRNESACANVKQGEMVAFTVHSPTGKLVENYVPTFQNIILNMGNGYNATSGKFRCPVSGLYLITVTLWGDLWRTTSFYCDVYRNTKPVTAVYKQKGSTDSASVTLVLSLSSGNEVYLSCNNWPRHNIYKNHRTLFSGSLIKAN